MLKNRPLVTVVIPVYNTGKYLNDCLSSIYNQTYNNIKVIIVNDGSKDDSGLIIDKYYRKYKNKTLVLKNTIPSGSGEVASNGAIKIAKGKYIAIMDSDDISLDNRIETEVDFLENNLNYFLVSASAEIIDENNNKISFLDVGKKYKEILKKIYLINSIINSSVMFRKSVINDDFYKIKYPFFNDYYSWFYYLSKNKRFYILKDRLVKYRINLSSSTRKNFKRNLNISFKIKDEIKQRKIFKISFLDRLNISIQKIIVYCFPCRIIDFLYLIKIKF
jgi:glycosyltransferase EpsE